MISYDFTKFGTSRSVFQKHGVEDIGSRFQDEPHQHHACLKRWFLMNGTHGFNYLYIKNHRIFYLATAATFFLAKAAR